MIICLKICKYELIKYCFGRKLKIYEFTKTRLNESNIRDGERQKDG